MRPKMMREWLALPGLLLCCAMALAEGPPPLTHGLVALDPPPPAPTLRLPDLDEEPVDLETLRGRVVVVNFWATWCPPCRREMGSLERLYRALKDRGVEVVAVDIGEDADTVFAFLGQVDPPPGFTVLLDREGAVLERWGVRGLPTTFVIDRAGRVRYRAVGGRAFDHPEILRAVGALATAE